MSTKQALSDPPIDYLRERYKQALRAHRYDDEQTSSVVVDGIAIPTSREMRAILTTALLCGETTKRLKLDASTWVMLTADQMRTALVLITSYVQGLFDAEAEALAAADTMTATDMLIRM